MAGADLPTARPVVWLAVRLSSTCPTPSPTRRGETFTTASLGLTMQCAQCHDHKFDPIMQHDYYGLAAAFDQAGLTPLGSRASVAFMVVILELRSWRASYSTFQRTSSVFLKACSRMRPTEVSEKETETQPSLAHEKPGRRIGTSIGNTCLSGRAGRGGMLKAGPAPPPKPFAGDQPATRDR